jgi:hypothetical protein
VTDGGYVKILMDNRIIVDISYFRKVNSNYVRPAINELIRSSLSSLYYYYPVNNGDKIKSNSFDLILLNKDDLMICCQTVYGWSFGNKQWRKSLTRDTLIVIRLVNVMRSGIPNKLYRKNRLESIFFSQSRDPY